MFDTTPAWPTRETPDGTTISAPPGQAAGDYVLTLDCPDRPGIVHAASGFLIQQGGNIIESQQFGDRITNRFFMRIDFEVGTPGKGYWIEPDAVPGIAARNAPFRPQLDRETADAVHEHLERLGVPGGYHGRWDRLLKELGVERETVEQVSRPTETAEQAGTESLGQRVVREAVERSRSDQEKQRFDDLVRNSGWDAETETFRDAEAVRDVPRNAPAILRLMAQAFLARDAEQLPTKVLINDLGGTLTAHALGRLMGHCGVSPGHNVIWDGKAVRGYRWVDVETSLKRNDWPQQAFDWEP